jgi:hypothetical protein
MCFSHGTANSSPNSPKLTVVAKIVPQSLACAEFAAFCAGPA